MVLSVYGKFARSDRDVRLLVLHLPSLAPWLLLRSKLLGLMPKWRAL